MAVTEILRGIGSWSFQLRQDTPPRVMNALKYFGHIMINTGRVDPRVVGDAGLAASRYVGIYRGKGASADQYTLIGPGLAAWLGDEDGKGEIFETPLAINHDFEDAIPLLLPDSIAPGTIYDLNPGVPFQTTIQYVTPREAIDYICQTIGAVWKVNNDGTLDAGLESDLFTVVPKAAVRRKNSGDDMFMKSFLGKLATDQDMNDFTTRLLLLASGTEGSTVTATADIDPGLNPYVDLHGNVVKLTRIVSESETDATNAPARAQLQLNRFSGPRQSLTMSTSRYDLKGDVEVGDYLWAYDPEVGVYDLDNEVVFQGERFWPTALQLTEMTWPIIKGMSVAYRDGAGNWLDLTDHILWESGETTLVVGGYNRSLGGDGGIGGSRPIPDTSVPDAPTWNPDEFQYSVYQSPIDGSTRAQVNLSWDQPLNIGGTPILDGDHYEIRYRPSTTPIFPVTHQQMSLLTHAALAAGTHQNPITYPAVDDWETAYVPFDQQTYMLQNLPTNMPYEAQIRAVDAAKPPNPSDWSSNVVFQTSADTIPPATPAPPSSLAASILSIQVTHELGRADGGTFNLDLDLHHLEIHGGNYSNFTPTADSLIGKALANAGMMFANTPVVASFPLDNLAPVFFKVIAVDGDGNASPASTAISATAELVNDAHITSLTVSKVTAGTITANWLQAGIMRTGISPNPRVEMAYYGITAYDNNNSLTFFVDSFTGNLWMRGELRSGPDSGSRVIINPNNSGYPEIRFYPTGGASTPCVRLLAHSYNDPRGAPNAGMKWSQLDGSGFDAGGEIEMGQTGVKMGHYNAFTGQWAYYWIDEQSRHALRGTFNASNYDSYSALVVGQSGFINPNGGVFTGSVSYGGPTLASNARIIANTVNYGINQHTWGIAVLDGNTQNGFSYAISFQWNELGGGYYTMPNGYINYWAYRI